MTIKFREELENFTVSINIARKEALTLVFPYHFIKPFFFLLKSY